MTFWLKSSWVFHYTQKKLNFLQRDQQQPRVERHVTVSPFCLGYALYPQNGSGAVQLHPRLGPFSRDLGPCRARWKGSYIVEAARSEVFWVPVWTSAVGSATLYFRGGPFRCAKSAALDRQSGGVCASVSPPTASCFRTRPRWGVLWAHGHVWFRSGTDETGIEHVEPTCGTFPTICLFFF